jgi:hypothetical protein
MFVVLEGTVNIYTGDEKNDIESVIDLTHHQFTGELNMLNDQRAPVGGRTTADSVLLRVTRDNLQHFTRAEGEVANLIMQAFIWRRIGLASRTRAGVILTGDEGDAETLKLQRFLRRNGYPHRVVSEQAYESSPCDDVCFCAAGLLAGCCFRRWARCCIVLPSLCSGTNSASPSCRMRTQTMTWPLSGSGPLVWRRLSMLYRRVCQRLSSKASPRADRRAQVPKSRTISAFPRKSQVKGWPTVLGCNP